MKKSLYLLVVLTAAASMSGCMVRARRPVANVSYSAQVGYANPGVVVYQPPPPAQVVVNAQTQAPYQGAIWVQPNWQWNGAQYVWVDGYWEQPRVGYVYVQPTWQRRGNGWVYQQGNWRPGRATVQVNTGRVVQPRGRATVQVNTGRVVQPRGGATVQVVQPRGGATVQVVQPRGGATVQVNTNNGRARTTRQRGTATVQVRGPQPPTVGGSGRATVRVR